MALRGCIGGTLARRRRPENQTVMSSDHEFFTDPQRISRLPRRPWDVSTLEHGGTTSYQVVSADGDVVGSFADSDYDGPGAARAIAESIVKWANAEPVPAPPARSTPPGRGHLRLL